MTDAKCYCGSYHDTVHGFKEHHKNVHGRWPLRSVVQRAIIRAQEGPD